MDFTRKLDPELAAVLRAMPEEVARGVSDWDDLPATREFTARMLARMVAGIPDSDNVLKEDREVPGREGDPGFRSASTGRTGARPPTARRPACSGSPAAAT